MVAAKLRLLPLWLVSDARLDLKYGVPVALVTDDAGVARSTMTLEFRKAVEEFRLRRLFGATFAAACGAVDNPNLVDGGNGNDTGTGHTPNMGNAQDLTNLLGKMLRVFEPDASRRYPIETLPTIGRRVSVCTPTFAVQLAGSSACGPSERAFSGQL